VEFEEAIISPFEWNSHLPHRIQRAAGAGEVRWGSFACRKERKFHCMEDVSGFFHGGRVRFLQGSSFSFENKGLLP